MAPEAETAERIARGGQALGLSLDAARCEALAHYVALLERWNRVFNLTGTSGVDTLVGRHILDCLALAPWLEALPGPESPQAADLGSGAGLPGMVLALALPRWTFHLVEPRRKRARFLRHAAGELALGTRVQVVERRAEAWRPCVPLQAVVCRAFGALEQIVELGGAWLGPEGRVLAMRGRVSGPEREWVEAQGGRVRSLQVPGLEAVRSLVVVPARGGANALSSPPPAAVDEGRTAGEGREGAVGRDPGPEPGSPSPGGRGARGAGGREEPGERGRQGPEERGT